MSAPTFTLSRPVLACALLLTTVIVGCRSSAPPPAATPAVTADTWATVDGKQIMQSDVDKVYRRLGDPAQTPSEEEALAAKLGILDDLILEQILLAKARQLNVQVPETEIDAAYAKSKENMSDEAFQQQLTRRNLTPADMREGLRNQLTAQKVVDQEVGAKIVVTDQQVIDFFNANRSQFNLPEDSYHLAQIIVTPGRDQQIANRTGDDAGTPEAMNQKIAMLMERLKQGTPFGDLARDFSEDPESAPRGGDLGLVPVSAVKQAPPPLRDAVLQMKPGSARVVNQEGARAIIYVVAQEKAGQRDLSTPNVKEQISQTLKARREQLLRTAFLTSARSDAKVENFIARRVVQEQTKDAPKSPAPAPAPAPAAK